MTYADYESSVDEAQPVELYDIYTSDGVHYRKHTGDDDITYLSNVYSKGIVDRTEIIIGGEIEDDNAVTIKLNRGDSFAVLFVGAPIDALVFLNIYRQYNTDYSKLWSGYLTHVGFDKKGMPICRFENILTSSIRMGRRRRCSRLCNYSLYCSGCNVNQELYKVTGTITNISGLVITSSQFATESDGYWVGGKIRVGTAYRLITAHTTNTITIDRLFVDAEIGDSFTAYAGCFHTPTVCLVKFGNKINFGGNEFLPMENPFVKSVIL